MSLDRKDVRFKVDHDTHAALAAIAEADGVDIAELVERWVSAEVTRRVHAATLIHDRVARLGKAGTRRDSTGAAGK
jgi:hypothetical protein